MTETLKLLKRFAFCALLLLCLTACVCGAVLVDANTRYLSLGEQGRQVGFSMDSETTAFTTENVKFEMKMQNAEIILISAFTFLICM